MSSVFIAQYSGFCPECEKHISEGDRVRYDAEDQVVHEVCKVEVLFEHPVCQVCWLTHPKGECDR